LYLCKSDSYFIKGLIVVTVDVVLSASEDKKYGLWISAFTSNDIGFLTLYQSTSYTTESFVYADTNSCSAGTGFIPKTFIYTSA